MCIYIYIVFFEQSRRRVIEDRFCMDLRCWKCCPPAWGKSLKNFSIRLPKQVRQYEEGLDLFFAFGVGVSNFFAECHGQHAEAAHNRQ